MKSKNSEKSEIGFLKDFGFLTDDQIRKLKDCIKINEPRDVERAAERRMLSELNTFSKIDEERILISIENQKPDFKRKLLGRITPAVDRMKSSIEEFSEVEKVVPVGEFRRKIPDMDKLELLVLQNKDLSTEKIKKLDFVKNLETAGENRLELSRVDGVKVILTFSSNENFPKKLLFLTGSVHHVKKLKDSSPSRLQDISKLNGNNMDVRELEKDIYENLGLNYIPPILREGYGEIEASKQGELPKLVKKEDIKGDFQVHSNFSDGENKMEEMIKKAEKTGLDYIVFTDHSHYFKENGSWNREKFQSQKNEIQKLNEKSDLKILHSIETNILEDGIHEPEEWLEQLDLICTGLHHDIEKPTDNIVKTFENHPIDLFVHPFGRTIYESEIDYDFRKVAEKAIEKNVALEISCQPMRMNLPWNIIKEYKGKVKFAISTDAHSPNQLDFLKYGVDQARKGWCQRSDLLNCLSPDRLKKSLNSQGD